MAVYLGSNKLSGNGTNTDEHLDVYSTEEQVIGKWMDKPLYRKTVKKTNLSFSPSANIYIEHQIDNVNEILKVNYSMFYDRDGCWYTDWDGIINTRTGTDSVVFTASSTANVTLSIAYVTLEYTKTTD